MMLLRRVIEHVKAQNWMAVALDFVIVVVGVFIGIQVSNWNDARSERAVERRYLERLLFDTEANVKELERLVDVHRRRGRTLSDLAAALQGGDEPPSDDALQGPLCRWFAAPLPALRQGTFNELVSSGALNVLRDEKLRTLLAEYAAEEEKSAYLTTLLPAVQRAAAPLDEYRSWAVAASSDETVDAGVRCDFDIDGMRHDPHMPSVVAQLYRDQTNHEYFRSAELGKARAVEARLNELTGVRTGKRNGESGP